MFIIEELKKYNFNNITIFVDMDAVVADYRFNDGGHFVSEETMNNVYCDDIFECNYYDENRGYIDIEGVLYPVYRIDNNKNISKIELEIFMRYNIAGMLNYYNSFEEVKKYETKKNSKRYLAEQNK